MARSWLPAAVFLLALAGTVAGARLVGAETRVVPSIGVRAGPPRIALAMARSCAPHSVECGRGPQGNGGCYQPVSQICFGGRICHHGQSLCPRGITGVGACYTLSQRNFCEDGIMCPDFYNVCRRGAKGPGGCYQASRSTCDAGRIAARPRR